LKERKEEANKQRRKEINFFTCDIYDLELAPEHTEEKGGEKKNKEKDISFHP
jgi:hypothetical protein